MRPRRCKKQRDSEHHFVHEWLAKHILASFEIPRNAFLEINDNVDASAAWKSMPCGDARFGGKLALREVGLVALVLFVSSARIDFAGQRRIHRPAAFQEFAEIAEQAYPRT